MVAEKALVGIWVKEDGAKREIVVHTDKKVKR
jgi:hypothetical protein